MQTVRPEGLEYLDKHFVPLKGKVKWDAEATGIAPLTMFEGFAGVGAPYLASAGLPIETVAISEHSGYAPTQCQVWKTWTDVPNLDDITAPDLAGRYGVLLNGRDPHIMIGGSPCQPFSFAGNRQGLRDIRGNLALRYCELIDEVNPEISGWENVFGVLNDPTNAFGHLIGHLSGFRRPRTDWSPLRADPRFARVFEESPDVAGMLDDHPGLCSLLLDDEAFRVAVTEPSEKVKDLRRSFPKAISKEHGAALAKPLGKAVLDGDREAFLSALAAAPSAAAEVLVAFSPFAVAPHEILPPDAYCTMTKGTLKRRWPNAGVVAGPSRVVAWRVIDAQHYGVAQRRRRIFAVATKVGNGLDPTAILFDWPERPPRKAGGKGKVKVPDIHIKGATGDVMVWLPDPKTKRFGTDCEPHWGEGPLNPGRKAKLSDPGCLLRTFVPESYDLSALACLGILYRADRRDKAIPVRLEAGLDEYVCGGLDLVAGHVEAELADCRAALLAIEELDAALKGATRLGAADFARKLESLTTLVARNDALAAIRTGGAKGSAEDADDTDTATATDTDTDTDTDDEEI
ncbi:hypothetical protein TSO5_15740 [Azospirillum sp. TSO5]|nr:hypothetical protein TSO5_15740 [Azospirillum sp. TSO5]